jgi:hypothetical protein
VNDGTLKPGAKDRFVVTERFNFLWSYEEEEKIKNALLSERENGDSSITFDVILLKLPIKPGT